MLQDSDGGQPQLGLSCGCPPSESSIHPPVLVDGCVRTGRKHGKSVVEVQYA